MTSALVCIIQRLDRLNDDLRIALSRINDLRIEIVVSERIFHYLQSEPVCLILPEWSYRL